MPIEIVLIGATKLKEMISLQQRKIVAQVVVLAVPESGTGLLSVYVIGRKDLGFVFTERLQRATNCAGNYSENRW
jgi:hypothetical protein